MKSPHAPPLIPAAALAILLGSLAALQAEVEIDRARLNESLERLSQHPHHLAGSDLGRAAGDAIIRQLRAAGIPDDRVLVQPFEVTQLRLEPGDCYLEREGERAPAQPLRPNGLSLPVTPPEGIEGETVYLGDGRWEQFRDRSLAGRIAVLDCDCGDRWQRAVQAGAVAVVFIAPSDGPDSANRLRERDSKWFRAHLDIPRFAVKAEDAKTHGLLSGSRIRLLCRMGFQRAFGRNIFVLIPGTAPEKEVADDMVSLACHYDTFGPLPFLSQSPVVAANAAGLVEAAAWFNGHPLERTVLIAFFDNNAQEQAGQFFLHFARELSLGEDVANSIARMLRDRQAEEGYLSARLSAFENIPEIVTGNGRERVSESVRKSILDEAEWRYDRAVGELSEARREKNLLLRRVEVLERQVRQHEQETGSPEDETAGKRLAQLRKELEDARRDAAVLKDKAEDRLQAAQTARDAIYRVRRLLVARKMPDETESGETQALFHAILSSVRGGWQERLAELRQERDFLVQSQQLGAKLHGRRLLAMLYWNMLPAARAWTVTGPAPGTVSNLQLARWLQGRTARGVPEGTGSGGVGEPAGSGGAASEPAGPTLKSFGGFVEGSFGRSSNDVSAWATYTLELGSAGAESASPGYRASKSDIRAFADRANEAMALVNALANRPEVTRVRVPQRLTAVVFNTPKWTESGRYDGCYVREYNERTKTGRPIPNAVILIQARYAVTGDTPADEWGAALTSSNLVGTFCLLARAHKGVAMVAAVHDDQGRIARMSQLHPDGALGKAGEWEASSWYLEDRNNQLVVFDVRQRLFFAGVRSTTGRTAARDVKFFNSLSGTKPKELNLTMSDDLLAAYCGRLRQYKLLQGSQVLLNSSALNPVGDGYEPGKGVVDALALAASDAWTLNEDRLNNLRRHNIVQNALERLHTRAESLQDTAEQTAADRPGVSWAARFASLGYCDRVYGPVRAVTNNLVQAVVILLLLAIPFSFALERVLIGTPNVYRQILGFAATFGAVFWILYLVHPAFRFAAFPLVVLLAFTIIIMSSVVIAIMWGKFEYEVRKLHGLATASHQSTRTARGTILAAVAQGMATMRRRPLRTALTAATILLLTFTILFFGSFSAEDGIRTVFVGPGPKTRQIEVGAVPGRPFDPETAAMVRLLCADSAESYARQWAVATGENVLAGRLPDDTVFGAEGCATLPPRDLELYPALRTALTGDLDGFRREGGIFLPARLYERVPEGQRNGFVDFGGHRYRLRGCFDPVKLKAIRTLDGASFVPPDLEETRRQLEVEFPRDEQAVDLKLREMPLEDFPPLDPEKVVLLWRPRSEDLSDQASSLVFLPGFDDQAKTLAAEIATLLGCRVSLAVGGEHFRVLYGKRLALGGFRKVIIPLILGGMIIFGTMLSSVTDREKEIYTFSALGLAPRHVAALFFAEAAVYAVIGGMGGYLFAHVFAKGIELLAKQGWGEAPAMNHSSMNAMVTLLIVMATVMLSTIYPAFKASRSANSGIQRRWRLPEPAGDLFQVEFPFTVSDYDMVGLVSFLQEYMESHHDKSVGSFAADRVKVEHADGRFALSAVVWLQPFDQGVSQTFALHTRPSDIEGIDEVHVEMRRLSGSPAIWRRSSKVFIYDLRNQFILWRTIPDDAAEQYHEMTAKRFGLPEPAQGA